MTNPDDRRAADLIDAIISAYHTTRLRETPVAAHILRKDRVRQMLDDMNLAAERRGMERAAEWQDIAIAPYAMCVMAAWFDNDCGEWAYSVELSPPPAPFTHWQPLPTPPAAIRAEINEGG